MDAKTLAQVMGDIPGVPYDTYAPHFDQALSDAGCTTVLRAAHFIGQMGHESGGLRYLEEIASGAAYEGRTDIGNTQPGDGVRYKGRGIVQLTGRANYAAFGRWALSKNLVADANYFVNDPTSVSDPQWAFRVAAYYWTVARNINPLADQDDLIAVTKAVNGGTRGIDDRRLYYQRAKSLGGAILPSGGGDVLGTYFDVDWSDRFGFGGPRPMSGIQRIVVHTTENTAGTPAENVANYQLTSETGSYHVLVDTTGKRLRENTDDWITWSTGNNAGNVQGVNLSFVAQAAWTRSQWLAQEKMLRAGATVVAYWAKAHNIPVAKVSTGRGVCGHGDLRAFGGTDHTDPGPNFPWDVFLDYVKSAGSGGQNEGDDMSAAAEKRIEEIHYQLLNRWPQLGNRTLVDAVQLVIDQMVGPGKNADGSFRFDGWEGVDGNGGKTVVEALAEVQSLVKKLQGEISELKGVK